MELTFGAILETLLVGTIASLCVLTVLFLFVPAFIRIESVRYLFRFLLYEDRFVEQSAEREIVSANGSAVPPLSPSRPPPPMDEEGRHGQLLHGARFEAYKLFTGLLLAATLYGAGIIAEAMSSFVTRSEFGSSAFGRSLRFFSDPEIRINAFNAVGSGSLISGNIPQQFAEFLADYSACRGANLLQNRLYSPTCEAIWRRANAFYYEAKNLIFQTDSYFQELHHLQGRINFTRAMSQCLALLATLLICAFVVGTISEALQSENALPPRLRPWREWLVRRARVKQIMVWPPLGRLLTHWTSLGAQRCLLMGVFALALAMVGLISWRTSEDDFDRRVFGYYLATISQLAHNSGSAATTRADTAAAGAQPKAFYIESALPKSTYRVFELPCGEPFEPSAVASIGDGDHVIVANDKGRSTGLALFHFSESNGLEPRVLLPLAGDAEVEPRRARGVADAPSPESAEHAEQPLCETLEMKAEESAQMSIGRLTKIESLHVAQSETKDGRDGSYRVLAATSFGRKASNGQADPDNQKIVELVVSADLEHLVAGQIVPIENPCQVLNPIVGPADCVVEGMTARNDHEILLGVRYVTEAKQRKPVLALLRFQRPPSGTWRGKLLWRVELDARVSGEDERNPFAGSGISALEMAHDGSLLVLTSIEDDRQPGSSDQVRGALWRIPRKEIELAKKMKFHADLERPERYPSSYLVSVFAHKPEGVTVLNDEGLILVVFDDDGRRKSRIYAPQTFALNQDQGAFSVLRPLPSLVP